MTDRPAPLAEWAEQVYSREGVAPACLRLQDDHGLSVPVLLAVVWAVAEAGIDDDRLIPVLEDASGPVAGEVVGPLRAVRRRLRAAVDHLAPEVTKRLHDLTLEVEIEAERAQLRALEEVLTTLERVDSEPHPSDGFGRVAGALRALLERSGARVVRPAVEDLAQVLAAARVTRVPDEDRLSTALGGQQP